MNTELKGIKQYKGHNDRDLIGVDTILSESVVFDCYKNYDRENEKYIQIFLWREQVEELYKQLGDWLGVTND